MRGSSLRLLLVVLLILAVVPYFVDLGGSSIWDANEAYYVDTPREMMDRGDYVIPMFNYEPRLNKPVLSYWMVAGLYKVFGVSVGVQRFGIALGGMVLIAAAFTLAWLLVQPDIRNPQPHQTSTAALLAGVGLASDPRLVMFARRIFIDIWISAFMALILTFFALSERIPARRRLFLALMYVCVGLGVLTKGPIAAALPGLVFFLYLLVHRELRRVTEMMIPLGILIVAVIVVPWYYALYLRDGSTYIVTFFFGENVGRFVSGIGQINRRPWWFYGPVVLSDGLPLSLFLIPAAVLWFRRWQADRVQTLLWLWILTIVAFFSFSHDKQDLYVFPIVPAVAALGASAVLRWKDSPRVTVTTASVAGLVFAVLGAGVLYLLGGGGRVYAIEGVTAAGVVVVAGGLGAAVLAATRRIPVSVTVLVAALIAFNWIFVVRVLPSFERYKPVPPLSDYLRDRLQPDDRIAHFNVALPSMVYYLRRHVEPLYSAEGFVQAMQSSDRVYGVVSARDYEGMKDALAGRTCVLHRVPTFDVKLKGILARESLPELLLLTNQCEGR
jgi:4-amino-4-deoxy-L-arabinose transferase-like glycosyltransferase